MAPSKKNEGKKGQKKLNSEAKNNAKSMKGVAKKQAQVSRSEKKSGNKGRSGEESKRDENWTAGEMDVLVELCIKHVDLLESNLSSDVMKEMKNKKWEMIRTSVNA